ncbi:hypothetical protein KUV59_00080 [Marinobacter daepoensis]|uniref:hypothetical protein n=1 Tax=Marinobacter daepoensis TaxID=262077 RepID=UPI001C95D003|nr:hypothetical protein [Marinobacter daepoensis]MBY6031559.1 hypothetical protein [Marinobacter daepoensis]
MAQRSVPVHNHAMHRMPKSPLRSSLTTTNMKEVSRVLLTIEVFVCFAPVAYIWLLSLVAFPVMIMIFVEGGAPGSLAAPIATILGGPGLLGAGALFVALDSGKLMISKRKLWVFLVSGWIASAIGASMVGFGGVAIWAIFSAPVLASVHFLYLWLRAASNG